MVDILHKVGVKASSPNRVYDALTTIDGLAGWWTTKTQGRTSVGEVIDFRFDESTGRRGVDMKVVELVPGKHVEWQVVGGPDEWMGSRIVFDLEQEGDYVAVLFGHKGWREPSRFMHHCSTKWAVFLISLKSLIETGKGAPYPHDMHVMSDTQ